VNNQRKSGDYGLFWNKGQRRKQFDTTSEFQVLLQADPDADPMLSTSITSEMDSIGYCGIVSRAAALLACFVSVKQ